MRISAVIITLNEEKRIEKALKSLDFVDEIIVVDTNSRDRTAEIATSYGAKVFRKEWEGYASQRNYGISVASNEWILSIDADEVVSPQLKDEILNLDFSSEGYLIRRESYFYGKPIHCCGWWPDWGVRLFKKHLVKWEGDFVHESLIFKGRAKKLKGRIFHFPYENAGDLFDRMRLYAELWAKKETGKAPSWIKVCGEPFGNFISSYFFKGGVFHGWRGFTISFAQAYYSFLKYLFVKTGGKNNEY